MGEVARKISPFYLLLSVTPTSSLLFSVLLRHPHLSDLPNPLLEILKKQEELSILIMKKLSKCKKTVFYQSISR